MSFVYDRETHMAVDQERNTTICHSFGRDSDGYPIIHKYKYISPDLTFEFGAISHVEKRKFIRDGKEVEWPVDVAMDVLESSIHGGIRKSKHRPSWPLVPNKFAEVKAVIEEGMFALCAQRDLKDGSLLVSEFKVEFITHVDRDGKASSS